MAGILRGQQFQTIPAFSFASLEREGAAILERARQQACALIEQAEHDGRARAERVAQRVLEEARREGHAEGFAAGREEAQRKAFDEAQEQLRALAGSLETAIGRFDADKRALLARVETEWLQLAVALARRVCKRVAATYDEPVVANAQELLALARAEHDLQLHLHPSQVEVIERVLPELVRSAEHARHVTLSASEDVERGGCRLTGRTGTIDARLSTQLDRLAEALVPASGAAGEGADA